MAGPLYGAALHSLGGLRLPYAGAAILCALTSLAFVASAAAGTSEEAAPPAEVAQEAAAAVVAGAAPGGESAAQSWGALRDAPTWRLCAFQALSCGLVRSRPELPISLRPPP